MFKLFKVMLIYAGKIFKKQIYTSKIKSPSNILSGFSLFMLLLNVSFMALVAAGAADREDEAANVCLSFHAPSCNGDDV
jgi:hypothetical protein